MEDRKIQWHPAFVAAMDLEFGENRKDLIFEKEYNLNTKPLEIDLLVIKKNNFAKIINEIGNFFRGHNIMEYKSPGDHLNIDTFYKVTGYACLYKSYGQHVNERKAEDITISLVRHTKPKGLFQYFRENSIIYANPYPGIYYVLTGVLFPTQVVVTEELLKQNHIWLTALTENMQKKDMRNLLEKVDSISQKHDKALADSVLEVAGRVNKELIDELKGEDSMFDILKEIMASDIQEIAEKASEEARIKGEQEGRIKGEQEGRIKGEQEGRREGRREALVEGVINAISVVMDLGHSSEIAVTQTALKYKMTEEEIMKIWDSRKK